MQGTTTGGGVVGGTFAVSHVHLHVDMLGKIREVSHDLSAWLLGCLQHADLKGCATWLVRRKLITAAFSAR
jgi:hypothetical protein